MNQSREIFTLTIFLSKARVDTYLRWQTHTMLLRYADSYIAVVYLRGEGSLFLQVEPDGTPGAWVPRHVAKVLDGLEIEIKPGRLIAWPNYAVLHSGKPKLNDVVPPSAGGKVIITEPTSSSSPPPPSSSSSLSDAPRWILGPVAIVPGRTRLAQSGDCGGGGCKTARRPPPDPATASKYDAHDYEGDWGTSCCLPAAVDVRIEVRLCN
jgi:hypothetical protein